MKTGTPLLQSTRLLDQVRERVRYLHYSLKTEKAYLYWVRFFIRWSAAQGGSMRHPRDMGAAEVEAFLSMLANERKVSASTHNQALSALLFLYREVLNIDLPWLSNIGRPQQTKRIPSVLAKDEIAGLLAQMEGVTALLARLLYGTGMRLMEGMRLRVRNGNQIGKPSAVASKCRMRWKASTRRWGTHGGGFGCSHRLRFRLTHVAEWNAGTTCSRSACNAP